MVKSVFFIAVVFLIVSAISVAEAAVGLTCAPSREAMAEELAKYGETRVASRLNERDEIIERFQSSSMWTITRTMPSGGSCVMAWGWVVKPGALFPERAAYEI